MAEVNLEYASAALAEDHLRRARVFRRIVRWCAFTPMAVGVGILLLFWMSRWDELILAGLIMLPVGGLAVLTGLIFGGLWYWQRRACFLNHGTPIPYREIITTMLLLLSNFGVAFGCIWVGIRLVSFGH